MKTRFANPSARFAGSEDETRSFIIMLGVSVLCHLLLLGMFYVVPSSFNRPFRAGPRAINVDLVSLPSPGAPQPATKAPAPTPPPEPKAVKPEPVPVPKPPPPAVKKAPVSIAPQKKKPKIVKSLKKKTVPKNTTPVKVTRPTPKEKEPARSQTVNSAIDAMKKKVAGQEKERAAAGAGAGGVPGGAGVMTRLQNYELDVVATIIQNFAFPDQLGANLSNLETLISFRILPNGEITNVQIDKKSGSTILDEAAYRAVVKSSPVVPHPAGINRPYIAIGLRATPTGFN